MRKRTNVYCYALVYGQPHFDYRKRAYRLLGTFMLSCECNLELHADLFQKSISKVYLGSCYHTVQQGIDSELLKTIGSH